MSTFQGKGSQLVVCGRLRSMGVWRDVAVEKIVRQIKEAVVMT